MKIVHKIIILLALAILSQIVTTAIDYYHLGLIRSATTDITENTLPSIETLDDAQLQFASARRFIYLNIVQSNESDQANSEASLNKHFDNLNADLTTYEKNLISDKTDQDNINAVKAALADYRTTATEIISLSKANKKQEALDMTLKTGGPKADKVLQMLSKAADYNLALAKETRNKVFEAISDTFRSALIYGGLFLVAIVVLGVYLGRGITGSLAEMRTAMQELATRYDFTRRVEVRNQDEVGESLHALNGLIDTLHSSLRQLAQVGREVGQSVSNLSSASTELSTTAHSVSESASSMAAGVEEVTVSVTHVADRAQVCDQTAREAGRQASTGGQVIDNTITSINQIADQVRQSAAQIETLQDKTASINAVVNVIKEIADQTNLLALNAAIEAARAGELGRGFAVVADEVRKLAERTSSSTQEITGMVSAIQNEARQTVQTMQQTVRQVDQGVELAQQASNAIASIRQGADDVVDQVSEISSSMREQSSAGASMAQQVERVAQMSEESSAVAARTAEEGRRLHALNAQLEQAISRYRI